QAASGAEGPDDAADERSQVEIRGYLLAERVEGADLHKDVRMPGQGAERLDIVVTDRPIGAGADPPQMVDDDAGLGESPAHPVDLGEAIGIDQAGERLAGLGGGGEHRGVAGRLEPAGRGLLPSLLPYWLGPIIRCHRLDTERPHSLRLE